MPRGKPNKRYTPEFKKLVVETMRTEHVVIHKITKEQVIIADPAKGIVKKSPEELNCTQLDSISYCPTGCSSIGGHAI